MQFVAPGRRYSAKMETAFKKRQRLLFSPFVGFFLSYESFNFLRKQTANRGLPASGKDPSFLEYLSAETYRDVLFLVGSRICHRPSCYT
jgi:hypothetical protein